MRVEIDFPYLQSKDKLKGRREYLASVFKEGPKWVNDWFFNVDPVRSDQGIKPLKRLGNLIRGVFRQIVLPFPITYTNKKSQKLTKKQVVSIEEFILGSSKPESFFSAVRVGVNQYAGYLSGALISLVGITVPMIVTAGSISSFGTVPLVLCSLSAAYLLYVAARAQRKQAVTTGYLKLKRVHLRKKHTYKERLLVKMYTLVTLLERVKESAKKHPKDAKDIIIKNLQDQISEHGYSGDEKILVRILSEIVKGAIKKFKANITSNAINESELTDLSTDDINDRILLFKLDELINDLEEIDIREELKRLKLDPESEVNIDNKALFTDNTLKNVKTQTFDDEMNKFSTPNNSRGYHRYKSIESTTPSLVGSSPDNGSEQSENEYEIGTNPEIDVHSLKKLSIEKFQKRFSHLEDKSKQKKINDKLQKEEKLTNVTTREIKVPVIKGYSIENLAKSSSQDKDREKNIDFEYRLLIKKVMKIRIKELININERDIASILLSIQPTLVMGKLDNFSVIKNSGLPVEYRDSLINELREGFTKIESKSHGIYNLHNGTNSNGSKKRINRTRSRSVF